MTDGLKERPAVLARRKPRPAPDESVDPVDYTPAIVAPVQPQVASAIPEVASGGMAEKVAPVTGETEPAAVAVSQIVPIPESPAVSVPRAAPAPQPEQVTQAPATVTNTSKVAGAKKTSRREVTYPFSTRLSQNVMDVLYAASDAEDISVREAVEQAILSRWA
ncbi:hypothetical protein [Pseudarthrobacter sp. H2]|uniref:hypothetical protein n=1 Tax=Pseudarthrobacter sp. H2 TaxID=3418415 RepID=UPI003CF67D80